MQIKLLVVDDDIEVLQSLGKIFTTYIRGYLVLSATSANEGLSMMKEQHPDVVVVDVRLGRESGMDMIEDYYAYINKTKNSYHPAFIVITAYDDEKPREKAEKFKVDAYIMKPFTREKILYEVMAAISNLLHREIKALDTMKDGYEKRANKIKEVDKKLGLK